MNEDTPTDNTSDNWLILNCPNCKKEVKLRSGIDLGTAACPYCSEFLGDSSPVSDTAETLSPSTDDFPDSSEVEKNWQGDEQPARIKRRSKPPGGVEEPEWDRDPSAPKKTDEGGDTTEFVEVDPENPDAVRVRRVKRTKAVTPAQKLFRASLLAFLLLVGAGGLTLLIIAIVQGTSTVSKDIQNVAQLPEHVKDLIAEATAVSEITLAIREQELEAAYAVISGFCAAESDAERLAYVRDPNRVAPLMAEWHKLKNPTDLGQPQKLLMSRKEEIGGRFFILQAIEMTPDGTPRFFSLEQSENDIKLDWEVSSTYQPIPYEKFIAERPTQPVDYRVNIARGTYYDGQVFDEESYQCFELTYPGDSNFKLFGYTKRDSEVGVELTNITEVMKPAWILQLAYPSISKSEKQVEIKAISHRSWFY